MKGLKRVVWSVVGDAGSSRTDEGDGDLEEVLRQAARHSNVVGGILDDFLRPSRRELFSPNQIGAMQNRLHTAVDRSLDLWVVLYEHELDMPVGPYLDKCDVITFWTWYGADNLPSLKNNLRRVIDATPGKRRLAGCYMWDYGACRPLTTELMELQCETYLSFIQGGELDGIIICSNCIADVGIPEADWMREWVHEHARVAV
jgi:hypothetical protein